MIGARIKTIACGVFVAVALHSSNERKMTALEGWRSIWR